MSGTLNKRKSGEASSFKPEWEKDFFCIAWKDHSKCLICGSILQSLKRHTLKRHFCALHKEDYDSLSDEERRLKLEELRTAHNIANRDEQELEGSLNLPALQASYALSLLLAKSGKAFSAGAFMKETVLTAVRKMDPSSLPKYEGICLSRRTVTRRLQDIGLNVSQKLREAAENFVAYSLALDESTDVRDIAQLAIFIRGVDSSFNVTEELLDVVPIKGTTNGVDIFEATESAVDSFGLNFLTIASATTDGAPAMLGNNLGFIGQLRRRLQQLGVDPESFSNFHCMIHQEALCSKCARMKNVADCVIRIINSLRGSSLSHRQLKEFLLDIDADYQDIMYHTEVRWLSLGKVFARFFVLRDPFDVFLEMKGTPEPKLKDPQWIADLAFSADITEHLNALNLELQGKDQLIIDMYGHIEAFRNALELWESQLEATHFSHFCRLNEAIKNVASVDVTAYVDVIKDLKDEFSTKFQDFEKLKPMFDMFVAPYSLKVADVPVEFQMELLKLQSNSFLKEKFKMATSVKEFYQALPAQQYPKLHRRAAQIMFMFGSTYICEQFFSVVNRIKSKERSSLSDANLKHALRLCVSRIEPDIDAIISKFNVL